MTTPGALRRAEVPSLVAALPRAKLDGSEVVHGHQPWRPATEAAGTRFPAVAWPFTGWLWAGHWLL